MTTQSPISSTIKRLTLEYNDFDSIFSIRHLITLPNLNHLSLRGNNISKIRPASTPDVAEDDNRASLAFSSTLTTVDISLNKIDTWSFIDSLPNIFPGLSSLRISDNPIYTQPAAPARLNNLSEKPMSIDEAYMLTLSRLSSLKVLNYSTITPQDRRNSELYYLSLIGKELSASSSSEEQHIVESHPRYDELCEIYGPPVIKRTTDDVAVNHSERTSARFRPCVATASRGLQV